MEVRAAVVRRVIVEIPVMRVQEVPAVQRAAVHHDHKLQVFMVLDATDLMEYIRAGLAALVVEAREENLTHLPSPVYFSIPTA